MRGFGRSLGVLLLALQASGAGMAALAHAREPLPGPVSVEAQHGAQCPVLHDELHCALCQYAGARIALLPGVVLPAPDHPQTSRLQADLPHPGGHPRPPLAQPRAPPISLG